VKFEDFDYKTFEATFKILLYDDTGKVSIEEIN
jgi:hypothetical protein